MKKYINIIFTNKRYILDNIFGYYHGNIDKWNTLGNWYTYAIYTH